jgi:pimeloyl-ACP methyl ester carboxylesterase
LLETAAKTTHNPETGQRTQRLRTAMGVHSPTFHSSRSRTGSESRSGWVTVDGCRIAWEEIPSADETTQPLICLHAAGTGSREFRPLISRCPSGSRLILLDWPGHGRSDDLAAISGGASTLTVGLCSGVVEVLIEQLGIDKPILVGSGFGAAVAIHFAADHPGEVLGLVLSLPEGLVSANSAGPFSQKGRLGIKRLLRRMDGSGSGKIDPKARAAARRQALRMEALRPSMLGMRKAAGISLKLEQPGLRKAIETLSCPALFALSRDSEEFPSRKYMTLLDPSLAVVTHHQFTVFSGAFHPIWDEPDRFAIALASFVQARAPVGKHIHAWMLSEVDWPTKDNNLWKCVHPDCVAERVLPTGRDANASRHN